MDLASSNQAFLDLHEEFLGRHLPGLVVQVIKSNGGHGFLQNKLDDIGEAVASQSRQKLLQQFQQCPYMSAPGEPGNEDTGDIAET
jgi:hypothetical protein